MTGAAEPREPAADFDPQVGSDSLLLEAVDAMSEGLALFDENALLLWSSAAFGRLNGAVADLILPGMAWDIFLHDSVARGAMDGASRDRLRWIEERLDPEDPPAPAISVERPGGSVHELSLRPTTTGGFLLVQRDVTERRLLEENERNADLLLRKVLEACPANVVMSRIGDGYVIYRSPAAAELLGTTRSSHDFFASREERADFITALLPTGRVDDMPVAGLRPDGTRFPALLSARIIEYHGEEVMVSSTVDITKEVALRRRLAEQQEQIFQSEKMSALGELLAGVAHELNNPLSVVVGHSLMMREETTDPEILRRLEKISDAAERCVSIVKSFLAMARQQPIQLAPTNLLETFESAVEALRDGVDGLTMSVDLSFPVDLPEAQADANQIAQVAMNLVKNADQAIRDSGVGDRIAITARHDRGADMIEVIVSDNGPGVPADLRTRIFDPLFTTKEIGRGTGIGLAFCHRVLTAHGGEIRLANSGSGGATFVLRLPVALGVVASSEAHDASPEQVTPCRILVVDDEAEVTDFIREVLAKDGFAVDTSGSAEGALALALSVPYTLILTDLNMPGMGGRGLYESILREAPELAARVGFVTGDTMSPRVRGFLDSAGRPFLEKPVAPAELRSLARRTVSAARAEGGTA